MCRSVLPIFAQIGKRMGKIQITSESAWRQVKCGCGAEINVTVMCINWSELPKDQLVWQYFFENLCSSLRLVVSRLGWTQGKKYYDCSRRFNLSTVFLPYFLHCNTWTSPKSHSLVKVIACLSLPVFVSRQSLDECSLFGGSDSAREIWRGRAVGHSLWHNCG
jgi:hypothetical protein